MTLVGSTSTSKVSIIVPTHNYARFLKECLDSIQAQTFQGFEILVVDDASTDDPITIVGDYEVLFKRFREQQGVVPTKNFGIAHTFGEYICIIDADDVLEPTYLEKCVEVLDNNPKAAIAYTDFWHFGEKNNGVNFPEFSLEKLKEWNFILGSALLRRAAFNQVGGFSEEMQDGMEDYDLWLSICEKGWEAEHIPEYLYKYRAHGGNRTNTMNMKAQTERLWRRHGMADKIKPDLVSTEVAQPVVQSEPKRVSVTAEISTRGRYDSTLALAILGVAHQTYKPDKLFILDDTPNKKDLRTIPHFDGILRMLLLKGIMWEVVYMPSHGQVLNHQYVLDKATTDWIWRLDDDNFPEAHTLEMLVSNITPEVGAVGGLVLDPRGVSPLPQGVTNEIQDIYSGLNLQWFQPADPDLLFDVDHLYSTFIYRREAAKHGYCRELSVVGHREETIFTFEMKLAGWKLIVDPKATTWHFRENTGGIRTFNDKTLWDHDEEIFKRKMCEWGVTTRKDQVFVLDCGLGDHFVFKSLLPEIQKKYAGKRIVLGVCYPEVFDDVDVGIVSIATMKEILGDALDSHDVYKWCVNTGWKGTLIDAYRRRYLS